MNVTLWKQERAKISETSLINNDLTILKKVIDEIMDVQTFLSPLSRIRDKHITVCYANVSIVTRYDAYMFHLYICTVS